MISVISVVALVACVFRTVESVENNVCPTLEDYYTIKNNTKCWYDLSAQYTVPQIIRLLGYKVIEYRVPTEDGFVLTMFRIPSDNVINPRAKKHPVYLQHGLVATCAYFVGLGRNSLAFVLADAGYDVWLGNYRGNEYSEAHINMTVFSEEYWDHSMDEIVQYDFPAMFNTILHHTGHGSQIIYIGHSLGTTLGLMYTSKYPDIAKDTMKFLTLISPAYTLANMISPYRYLAPYGDWIIQTVRDLELTRIVSQASSLKRLVVPVCMESPPLMRLCMQLYNLFYGALTQLGPELIPVYFNQLPGGTALKILNHAADLVMGNFRHYNYQLDNFKKYGQAKPPVYDISRIRVPTYIIYSGSDWATTEKDALNLHRNLAKDVRYGIRNVNEIYFNHIDFVYGRNARRIVYDPLVEILNQVINS